MFGILEAVTVPHTGIYGSYEELIADLNHRVSKDGYKIVKARSHRGRIGGSSIPNNEMVRCDLVCDRGGRPYKCMATKHKTHTKKTDCPWRAKAVHRKTIGGWVLTITCDQHNHEPGTPEPPSPVELSDAEDVETTPDGPQPDPDTTIAMQLAGVPTSSLRLTGDTFHQIKGEYRKMPQHERLNHLAQMQLRIAAIYAVQNEDVQRNQRNEALKKRHSEIDEGRKSRQTNKQRARQTNKQNQESQQGQAQQVQNQQVPSQQQSPQLDGQAVQQQQQVQPQQVQQQSLPQVPQQQQQMLPQQQHQQNQQHQFQLAQQAHQAHQMQQAHIPQAPFPMSAPDSPGQQLLMNMAHIQQYNGPAPLGSAPKRGRGRPSQSVQQNA